MQHTYIYYTYLHTVWLPIADVYFIRHGFVTQTSKQVLYITNVMYVYNFFVILHLSWKSIYAYA